MAQHEHGTWNRYGAGCRCRRCRAAWRRYITDRRRARGIRSRASTDVHTTSAIVRRAVENGEDPKLAVELSPLGGQILVNIQQRTGRSRGAVLDDLLRQHGRDVPVRQQERDSSSA